MTEGWLDAEDELLARSTFETDDPAVVRRLIRTWARQQGFGQVTVTTLEFSVGAAVTIALPDQAKIFVKIWPGNTEVGSLAAQIDVQREMGARGFPAPAVLTNLSPLGPAWAVAMEHNRKGSPTDVRVPGVRWSMAAGLARFVAEAEIFRDRDGLPRRTLPAAGAIWPRPHSALFDFEATNEGAAWIDEIARNALAVMHAATSRIVVGHCDWSAKNMRMDGDSIAVLYDWDSVFLDRETFVLGTAAAHFPVTWELDVPETPSIDEVAAFVREYEQARGAPFTRLELAEIEAAATYARAYKARCEHAIDPQSARWNGSSRESLLANGPLRL